MRDYVEVKRIVSCSHKNNIYRHFQQHHGRKGNFDDVETSEEVLEELKKYIGDIGNDKDADEELA